MQRDRAAGRRSLSIFEGTRSPKLLFAQIITPAEDSANPAIKSNDPDISPFSMEKDDKKLISLVFAGNNFILSAKARLISEKLTI